MGIGVLGPVEVDGAVRLEPRDRAALAVLVVRQRESVAPDQFAEALWADTLPASWRKQVQICVGRLRKVLGPEVIVTTASGYRLVLDDADLDVRRFEALVQRARELGAVGEQARAAAAYRRALDLWRGPPFDEVEAWSPARSEAARLLELRRAVEEEWAAARMDAGEEREVAALAEALVNEEPLRERRWAILALARYRCARQADALRAIASARHVLGELGLDPGGELVELEAAILRQDPALAGSPAVAAASEACPYKGLAAYDEADTETFFGRDAEIQACLDRLRTTPLLVVAGPSGCGKSSLVRAGLSPALRRAGHDIVVVSPGADPAATLAQAAAGPAGAVWIVDQFEELFTLGAPAEEVRAFCSAVADRAREHPPVIVVVRSDHLGGFGVDGELSTLVQEGLHLVATLGGDSLRAAIEQPARLAGLRLEHGLVDLLVRDCEGEPGALPLLSHALAEVWRRRDGSTLTVEGYESSGGIRAAVARSADRLYDSLPGDQRDVLRSILLRLVTPTLDGDPVRCRVGSRSILGDPSRDRVVGLLVRARLVTTERDTFEIAHEALARAWPRLRSWLDDDVAGQRVLRHLVSAADGWDSLGRPDSELYRGARLAAALEWRDTSKPTLTSIEADFLDASARLAESERGALATQAARESRSNRRLRRLSAALAVVLVASLVAGGSAIHASREAERARRVASARELAAAASSSIAVDAERGVLLALEAVALARPLGGDVLRQAEEALHGALTASRIDWRVSGTGGAVDWSPRGRLVATAATEGTGSVDLREAGDGRITRTLAVAGAEVTDLAFAPSGDEIAVTYRDGAVRLWGVATGRPLWAVDGSGAPARAPSFSPDGTLLATASPRDDLARVLEVTTGAVVLDTRAVPGATATSWSPDGARLALASSVEPIGVVVEVASGATLATLDGHLGVLSDIAWSPDGRSIATSGNDGSARVFAADSGVESMVIPGHGAFVGAVAWDAGSTTLATSSADGTVRIWSLVEGGGRELDVLRAVDLRSGVDDIAFSPDGSRLIAGARNGVTSVWDVGLSAGSEVAILPAVSFFLSTAEFGPDGEHLYATFGGGRVGVWDVASRQLLATLGATGRSDVPVRHPTEVPMGSPGDFMSIAPSPDGELVALIADLSTGGSARGRVLVLDSRTGEPVLDLSVGSSAWNAVWSPGGDLLAVAAEDEDGSLVRLVDLSGSTVAELPFGRAKVGVAGFDSSSESLVVWIESVRVEVWDWRSATLEQEIDADPFTAVTSPADDLLAVGPSDLAPDPSVTVWDLRSGALVATLDDNGGSPNDLAFAADGAYLAEAGGDGTTRIWDPRTGELRLTLGGHIGLVSSVSFSPDGTRLATASVDGRVRLWALDTDSLVEIARGAVTRSLTDAECRRYLDRPRCPERR